MLKERDKKVLISIVVKYISSGEPVSSKTISSMNNIDVSSATIRNVMSSLEEEGYIFQPHISAGRIPTDKGYRFYVDNYVKVNDLNNKLKNEIESFLTKKIVDLDSLLKVTSNLLSKLSKKIGVSVSPILKKDKIKCFKLVPVSNNSLFVLIVTNSGIVREEFIQFEGNKHIDKVFLNRINNYLDEVLVDKYIHEAKKYLDYKRLFKNYEFIYKLIRNKINEADRENSDIYIDGIIDYLKRKGSNDIIDVVEDGVIKTIIGKEKSFDENHLMVKIGLENNNNMLSNYSLISRNIEIEDDLNIKIALIGEKRVNYTRMFSLLDYTAKVLENRFQGGDK